MAQLFHRSTNTIARVSIFGAVFFVAFLLWVFATLDRSPYSSGQGVIIEQPVPFSHDHHTAALGISCVYCHTSVEEAAFAGIPPTTTCINCHKLIWNQTEMLAPVRESLDKNEAIEWIRVHDLPDYVYFNHSVHLARGIGCVSCHGRVDEMPLIRQAKPLTMQWCLDCHRDPQDHVRPRDQVLNMAWSTDDQATLGPRLVEEYGIESLTSCSVCHR